MFNVSDTAAVVGTKALRSTEGLVKETNGAIGAADDDMVGACSDAGRFALLSGRCQ